MADNNIRARLTYALREHSDYDDGCKCGAELDYDDGNSHAAHCADILLSLPGIAIVELPEGTEWESQTDFVFARTDTRVPSEIAHFLTGGMGKWITALKARAIAAAFLAAANAAEETHV